jgi:hypothetical protein
MKKLKFSATITAILGFLSALTLFFLFLALSDISHKEEDLTLEWYVAGVCMMIIGAFIISTFVTLGFGLKYINVTQVQN